MHEIIHIHMHVHTYKCPLSIFSEMVLYQRAVIERRGQTLLEKEDC